MDIEHLFKMSERSWTRLLMLAFISVLTVALLLLLLSVESLVSHLLSLLL